MRHYFQGYYRPTDEQFAEIWQKAVFVLDANVLLNLYRYPAGAREELLGVLERVSDRVWLPFHAALEYQRNRLQVIAEQKKRFRDVREVLNNAKADLSANLNNMQLKKRHSSIEPDELIVGLDALTKDFFDKLDKQEESQQTVLDEDPTRLKLDEFFSGKVGPPPVDQESLDSMYQEGEFRYARSTPPGYMDAGKGTDAEDDGFQYGGLAYRRKFGDLILWKQIIQYANDSNLECVVFLTDDDKEDWWWIVDADGKKKIGPRPELIEEIRRQSKVENFYMYNSEQFMRFAKQYLKAEVSDESITQVRDTARLGHLRQSMFGGRRYYEMAEQSVLHWLSNGFPQTATIQRDRHSFPDFIVHDTDTLQGIGFEVKVPQRAHQVSPISKSALYRGYYEVNQGNLDEFYLVLAVDPKHVDLYEVMERAQRIIAEFSSALGIIIGKMEIIDDEDAEGYFEAVAQFGGRLQPNIEFSE